MNRRRGLHVPRDEHWSAGKTLIIVLVHSLVLWAGLIELYSWVVGITKWLLQ